MNKISDSQYSSHPHSSNQFKLTLGLEAINQILECLGQQPYSVVYQLVHDIRSQCERHINSLEEQENGAELHAVNSAQTANNSQAMNK